MTLNDPLANALSKIQNAEHTKREECMIFPTSKVLQKILELLQDRQFIGAAELVENSRGNSLKVNLLGRINKVGAIKPRFAIKHDGFERYEKRFLPAKDFGLIIVSTPKGIMAHTEAKKLGIGGRLLAYCY